MDTIGGKYDITVHDVLPPVPIHSWNLHPLPNLNTWRQQLAQFEAQSGRKPVALESGHPSVEVKAPCTFPNSPRQYQLPQRAYGRSQDRALRVCPNAVQIT